MRLQAVHRVSAGKEPRLLRAHGQSGRASISTRPTPPSTPPCKEYFDLLYISNSEIPELAGKPDFRIINSSYNIINFLILNPNENDQMRERKVRQLINYAINREDLVRKVFHHQAVPAHSMMPFGLLGHNPYYRLDYSPRRNDPRRAAPGQDLASPS